MHLSPCSYRNRFLCHFKAFAERCYIQFLTLCLGFYSLANVFALYGIPQIKVVAFVATGIVLTLALLRALYLPEKFLAELRTPAGLAAYQTGVMATYFFSLFLAEIDRPFGQSMWIVAFTINLLIIILFIQQNLRYNFQFVSITPIWYLIFVGIGAGAVTGYQLGFTRVAHFVAYYASFAYIIMTPFVLYRLLSYRPMAQKMQPTKAILAAAPSLSLVALLTVNPNLPMIVALPLFVLSQGFLFWLYGNFELFRLIPFCVTFGSFTFPLGISSVALYMFRTMVLTPGTVVAQVIRVIGHIEFAIATIVIMYTIGLFFYNSYWLWYGIGVKLRKGHKLCDSEGLGC